MSTKLVPEDDEILIGYDITELNQTQAKMLYDILRPMTLRELVAEYAQFRNLHDSVALPPKGLLKYANAWHILKHAYNAFSGPIHLSVAWMNSIEPIFDLLRSISETD